jgi:hypothetical protein
MPSISHIQIADALEEASTKRNIIPFIKLVAEAMKVDWSKE